MYDIVVYDIFVFIFVNSFLEGRLSLKDFRSLVLSCLRVDHTELALQIYSLLYVNMVVLDKELLLLLVDVFIRTSDISKAKFVCERLCSLALSSIQAVSSSSDSSSNSHSISTSIPHIGDVGCHFPDSVPDLTMRDFNFLFELLLKAKEESYAKLLLYDILQSLKGFSPQRYVPDHISYNIFFSHYTKRKRYDDCIAFYDELGQRGVLSSWIPNDACFASIVDAFYGLERYDAVLQLHDKMKFDGIRPQQITAQLILRSAAHLAKQQVVGPGTNSLDAHSNRLFVHRILPCVSKLCILQYKAFRSGLV